MLRRACLAFTMSGERRDLIKIKSEIEYCLIKCIINIYLAIFYLLKQRFLYIVRET